MENPTMAMYGALEDKCSALAGSLQTIYNAAKQQQTEHPNNCFFSWLLGEIEEVSALTGNTDLLEEVPF